MLWKGPMTAAAEFHLQPRVFCRVHALSQGNKLISDHIWYLLRIGNVAQMVEVHHYEFPFMGRHCRLSSTAACCRRLGRRLSCGCRGGHVCVAGCAPAADGGWQQKALT